jgi:copper homeostasis protein
VARMVRPAVLLEVTVVQPRDVRGAQEGGADRLHLVAAGGGSGRSPDLATVSAVLRETDVPVRVPLRLDEGLTTTGGEFARLVGLGEEFLALGAEGVCFGFLDADLEVDLETTAALAAALPGVPWTFHEGFDHALDARRSWRRVRSLPGLTAVASGGSPEGLGRGYDDTLRLAEADPGVAALLLPASGLTPEHVPWLVQAGVRQFRVGAQARPGGSAKAYVDAPLVRSWRLLVDGAGSRARPA